MITINSWCDSVGDDDGDDVDDDGDDDGVDDDGDNNDDDDDVWSCSIIGQYWWNGEIYIVGKVCVRDNTCIHIIHFHLHVILPIQFLYVELASQNNKLKIDDPPSCVHTTLGKLKNPFILDKMNQSKWTSSFTF